AACGVDGTSCSCQIDAEHLHLDPLAAYVQLGIPCLQVDHQVAIGLADADHRVGCEHVEHKLGHCSSLEPGASRHQLRADRHVDEDIREPYCCLGRHRAGDQRGGGSNFSRVRKRPGHERSGTTRGDANHDVAAVEIPPGECGGARPGIV